MKNRRLISTFLLCLFSFAAIAETADLSAKPPKLFQVRKAGWAFEFKLGATLGWNYSQDFVGQLDGNAVNVGGQLQTTADFNSGNHEWRNTLNALATFAYGPPLNQLVKSADNLTFESIYLYHIIPWLGPYGLAKFRTSMFEGHDVRASNVTYNVSEPAPSTAPVAVTGVSSLRLTTPFAPLILEQQIGVFAQALQSKPINLEFRVAASLRENIADGQKVVKSATATAVEVQKLQNAFEAGPAVGMSASGMLLKDKVSYVARIDAMLPLWQSPIAAPTTGGVFNKIAVDAMAGLSFHLLDWLSLDWQFKAIRQPVIIDRFQLLSNVLLTASYSL